MVTICFLKRRCRAMVRDSSTEQHIACQKCIGWDRVAITARIMDELSRKLQANGDPFHLNSYLCGFVPETLLRQVEAERVLDRQSVVWFDSSGQWVIGALLSRPRAPGYSVTYRLCYLTALVGSLQPASNIAPTGQPQTFPTLPMSPDRLRAAPPLP